MINELIKKYSDFYSGKSYSSIADRILEEEDNINLSHRTLRQKIGEYMKSKEEAKCCNSLVVCEAYPDTSRTKFTSWNQENTINYFSNPSRTYRLQSYLNGNPNNVLVLGDLHEPFCREDYMEHCLEQQRRFDCGQIVFIGDIKDSHASSFHDSNPDGLSAGIELDKAITRIKEWHRVFPNAKVTLGNHDLIILRKAFKAGLSSRWIKGLAEVLETPSWEYDMQFELHNVLYTHTLGGKLMNAAINRRQSTVAGHLHTQASIEWNVSNKDRIFAMQVGCGIDDTSYAFEYAKLNAKKSIISCGVVLDSGKLPILIPMEL